MKILVWYSFHWTRTAQILPHLRQLDSRILVEDWLHTNDVSNLLSDSSVEYVVWLGDYTWRDRNTIRVESFCTNKYRNSYIHWDTLEQQLLYVPHNKLTDEFLVGKWMGNGYCNASCWNILGRIQKTTRPIRMLFFHVPISYGIDSAIDQIDDLLASLLYEAD